MPKYDELPSRVEGGAIRVVVESPRGSRTKIAYDPELGVFAVSRELVLGLVYPYDWGFVPSTLANDGDPLDAMVLGDTGTASGIVIRARPIGVARVTQREGKGRISNDRVLFVPAEEKRYDELRDVRDLSKRTRASLEHFFLAATCFEKKEARTGGWAGPRAALALITQCEARWAREHARRSKRD
jgi:inorganic pyrophosphatase